MKIKFLIDIAEYFEGDEVNMKDEIALEHIEAGHAVSLEKKEEKSKKDK